MCDSGKKETEATSLSVLSILMPEVKEPMALVAVDLGTQSISKVQCI